MSSNAASRPPLIRSPTLSERDQVVHAFATRHGGCSPAPRDSLHLALKDGDRPQDVLENWRRLSAALDLRPSDVALLDQVHGAQVLTVHAPTGALHTAGQADGMVTATPGVLLAIRTADCVPVLLAAPGAVGAAHAGWRGVAAGVVPRTVERLVAVAGCAPGDVIAAVGPHASVERYETGPDVIQALVQAGLQRERISRVGPRGREHADLRQAVHDQLTAAGVRQVDHVRRCTLVDPDFFSHRRDGAGTGRQASVIALRRSVA